jgi:hypothetical protein
MPLFVKKNVSSISGGNDSTSSAADEQDNSFPSQGAGGFGAYSQGMSPSLNAYATSSSSTDPVDGTPATPPDDGGFDPNDAGDSGGGPDAPVAVTSGGITFNLTFDSFAPSSFRAGIVQAASILTAAISDQITVNLSIHYSGNNGGAFAGPSTGLFESLSATKAALTSHASLGDTIFNALPSGTSVQGQSSVAVWNAQLKALGFLAANNAASDAAGRVREECPIHPVLMAPNANG